MIKFTPLEKTIDEAGGKREAGMTLLLALLVLSSIMAISFSIATILLVEVRSSGDLLKTEPVLYGAESVTEEAIYKIKRQVPASLFSYPASIGNIQLNNPPPLESSTTTPVYRVVVLPNTNFQNTTNHYILAPSGVVSGSNYGRIKLTYLDNGNTSSLTVYVCEYNPNLPHDPGGGLPNSYRTIVCSEPNSDEYWLPDGKAFSLSLSGYSSYTWTLNPNKQQEIILYNSASPSNIYVQIEAFGPAPTYTPTGVPYSNAKSVDINASNAGVYRKIKVEVPK
jgi:hypothetical protein